MLDSESSGGPYNRDSFEDGDHPDLSSSQHNSSLTATARKAHNLFVSQQQKDVRSLSNQVKRQLSVTNPTADLVSKIAN